jgi:hypothetical protein
MALLLVLIGLTLSGSMPTAACIAQDAPKDESVEKFVKGMKTAFHMIRNGHVAPTTEGQMTIWAIRGLYQTLKVPIPLTLSKRLEKANEPGPAEVERLLRDARSDLGARPELLDRKDLFIAVDAILAQLEPCAAPEHRSRVLRPEELPRCRLRFDPPRLGVGITLEPDPKTDMLRVVTVAFDGPAHKAGIRGGDLVTHIRIYPEVGGQPNVPDKGGKRPMAPITLSTKGMTVAEANELLLGRLGSQVTLTVVPASSSKKRDTLK